MPYLSSSTNSLDSDMCGVAEGGEKESSGIESERGKFPVTQQLQGMVVHFMDQIRERTMNINIRL